MSLPLIKEYFPNLAAEQFAQLEGLAEMLAEWNDKINVISRRDIDNLEERHLLHSLSIYKFMPFPADVHVLDFGCGGGLPGLPLAIVCPDTQFHLIDRIGKKIKVASDIVERLGLKNVTFQHGDIAECKLKFNYVVSRAVMPLPDLMHLSARLISPPSKGQTLPFPPGLITLKGGDIDAELGRWKSTTEIVPLSTYYPTLPFFETKLLTYTPYPQR